VVAEVFLESGMLAENARLRQLLIQAGLDASQHEVTEKLQRLLLEELHHRVKNTLATVNAITKQSLRSAESLMEAEEAISTRLAALGRAHDLLLNISWSSARLNTVIAGSIEAFGKDRFDIHGMDVEIGAGAVLPVAMMLNELCTNAVKYGALSNAAGRIEIAGTADETPGFLHVVWTERGGPAVVPPAERSFGTRLIEMSFSQSQGKTEIRFEPAGLVCAFRVPLSRPSPS
jgi:two-component sensor histidine kinase